MAVDDFYQQALLALKTLNRRIQIALEQGKEISATDLELRDKLTAEIAGYEPEVRSIYDDPAV